MLVSTIAYMEESPLIAAPQIDVLGIGNVVAFRERAMETPLNERDILLFACRGEILVSASYWITKARILIVSRRIIQQSPIGLRPGGTILLSYRAARRLCILSVRAATYFYS